MTADEEKIKVIEKVLEADDALLLREITSLLHTPALTDYPNQPMSRDELMAKIERTEAAYRMGESSQRSVEPLFKPRNEPPANGASVGIN